MAPKVKATARRTSTKKHDPAATAASTGADDVPGDEKIANKKELDKMYSAMRFLKGKGDSSPLEAYMVLTTRKDKSDFWKKFKLDKTFGWLKVAAATTT